VFVPAAKEAVWVDDANNKIKKLVERQILRLDATYKG
jgi:hypothetical protein